MNSVLKQICVPFTPIWSSYEKNSLLETEALYGEKIKILKVYNDWYYGELETDGYKGWIKKDHLTHVHKINFKISVSLSIVNSEPSHKSRVITYLPMGAYIYAIKYNVKWHKIRLTLNKKEVFGFIPNSHISKIGVTNKNWVNYSKSFLSCPYKWGGRTYLGIDCSALLQLSLQIAGILLPRNSSDQISTKYMTYIKDRTLNKGDIVYWPGHIGIMVSAKRIIHSNASTGNTVIQSLRDVNMKIVKETGFSYKTFRVNFNT